MSMKGRNRNAWIASQQRSINGNRKSLKNIVKKVYNEGGNDDGKHSSSSAAVHNEIDRRGV